MAKYSNTKAKINEKITTNSAQAITGNILNDVLQTMVDSLGADYQFGGLVQPGSTFTAGEQPVVFLATTPGTYTNFGGLVVADGDVALLVWSGTAWSKQTPDIATRTEVSQLGQKMQELMLEELLGAAYETWNTSEGQTHYVIPVNGGERVTFDNSIGTIYCAFLKSYTKPVSGATPDFCTGYLGRQQYNEDAAGFTLPNDCRFFIINGPNGVYALSSLVINGVETINGVHGSISNIGDKLLKLNDYTRYITPFYPCFVARTTNHDDVDITVSLAVGTTSSKNSAILKSFHKLILTGFDKTKPHFVSLFRNGYSSGTQYEIEFSKIDGSTITQVVRFYIPIAQITTPGGVNTIDVTDGNYRIQAIIDFSAFTLGGAFVGRTIEYANFIVAVSCFGDIYDYVDEALADTIKDTDLHLVAGANLADPDNIDDGHYVSNDGTIGENADWSMISVPVTAGVKYTFGGFFLGRNGYYCFYNGAEIVGSAVLFDDPNGIQYPVTVTAPVGANKIIIDIKTGNSPTGAYNNLMVNVGETLAQYEPYKVEIDKIKGYSIIGSESGGGDINGLLANLPVSSDGSTIPSGYAYIEQSTGTIKVKMS